MAKTFVILITFLFFGGLFLVTTSPKAKGTTVEQTGYPNHTPTPTKQKNSPPNLVSVTLDKRVVDKWCPISKRPDTGCPFNGERVRISVNANDPDGDAITYSYKVTGGKIIGKGADVVWNLTSLVPGNYSVAVGASGRGGSQSRTLTRSVKLQECPDCDLPCDCPTLSVTASDPSVKAGEVVIFSAIVSGWKGIKFEWTVENGTIVRGKSSKKVTVRSNNDTAGKNIVATVEISGTDPACNCSTMASGSVEIKP